MNSVKKAIAVEDVIRAPEVHGGDAVADLGNGQQMIMKEGSYGWGQRDKMGHRAGWPGPLAQLNRALTTA